MENETKNKRLISYALGIFCLCSLISFAVLSFKLVKTYNENKKLNELMNRIINDYNDDQIDLKGYYLSIDSDDDVDLNHGQVIVSFPNTK